MKRLVIIDGKSVFYRGYYAMGALALPDGTPTGGVYGFAAIAMEIVKNLAPTKVVVAWDSPTATAKRLAIYPEYKAGRVKPGEDFYAQIPLLKELVLALGWGFAECDEYEADDIIGTLARQADEDVDNAGACLWETLIVSSDLDMLQVVDENTRMYRVLKGFSRLEELDVAGVEAKYGILKPQFLDLKALKGDQSDNIPGVPGVGEKTAVKLLTDFGTLDGVYEGLEAGKITGKVAEKLAAGKDSAYMSYKLAKIMTDAPVTLADLPDLVIDKERIVEALKKLEFKSLIRRFEGIDARLVSSQKKGTLGETREKRFDSEQPDLFSLAEEQLASQEIDETLVAWDVKQLMHEDSEVAGKIEEGEKFWDLGQGAFLLDPLARERVRGEVAEEYARQKEEFQKFPALSTIFTQFDLPLIPVLFEMEKEGMLIDRQYFESLRREFEKEVRGKEEEIWALAGTEFNVNSPMQLADVLFTKLALPTKGIKKTARGYSTGVKELDKLQDRHPIIAKIKEYREAAKLLSTYIAPLPELADKDDRIHTTFNQDVTATGRLSSTNPNLQNIPVRTEVGRRIRTGFVAGAGKVLVNADYSQFELRLAAVLAGDEALLKDFEDDVDIHTKTAAEAFRVPMKEVTKVQRRAAKVINFGILYGMSVRGLAEAAGMGFYEAKEFIEHYFQLRKPIKEYLEKQLTLARSQGFVETFYGRRRPTPDVLSTNFVIRTAAERAAQNMPIQGTEADLMKRAMVKVFRRLSEYDKRARLVMQVHDSLMVECDEALAAEIGTMLKTEMEGVAPELGVRLKVDVSSGVNWGEL